MLRKIKHFFYKYTSIGTNETTSINDLKKIQLLHIFCYTWHFFSILSIFEDFIRERLTPLICFCYAIIILLVIAVQVLLSVDKTTKAGLLFISNIFFTVLFFCNYIYPAELLEYYFLLPPSIGLIYVDNKKVNISILILCLLALFLPNLYFKHYPYSMLNNMNASFLFFSFFIVISYFKNLNAKSEKILQAKTNELEELDKFKSQFFTNISHEIRTPLTLVNGYISELNYSTDAHNIKEIKHHVQQQVSKITNIIDSVLDLAKMQSSNFNLHLKSSNISELVEKMQMNFEPLFHQKKIQLEIIKSPIDYFSLIDITFFEKALNNIIINALKYTDTGKVTITLNKKNDKLIIKISDTGIGIAETDIKNVFNRFYQVNNDINKAGGSGIGLAFCKEIIELHKGTISLQSKINKGSEFEIILPVQKTSSTLSVSTEKNITTKEEVIEQNLINSTLNRSGLQFLIVDDNCDMRKYLTSILNKHTCFEAANGFEALDIISNNNIDLIITDYMMPKLNGYDLVCELNETNNNIPIIMLTAKTDMITKLNSLKLGIHDYLTKPFHKNELLTRISNCMKNHTTQKQFNKTQNIHIEQPKDNDFIHKLKNYIIKNSTDTSLNQDIIAIEFNFSKSSFYRKIKSITGLTPNNFIREIRLQKAYKIVKTNPSISLKELSYEVGYLHTNYFSKIYENRFGIKPL